MDSLEVVASQLDFLIDNPLAILCELSHYTIVISGVKKSWGKLNFNMQLYGFF